MKKSDAADTAFVTGTPINRTVADSAKLPPARTVNSGTRLVGAGNTPAVGGKGSGPIKTVSGQPQNQGSRSFKQGRN